MFRKAVTKDIPYINSILDEFNSPHIDTLNSEYLLYDDKGIINYTFIQDEAEIYFLYVEKDYRKQNIGGKLLEEMLSECRMNNCHQVFLEVRKNNIPAINLYKKYGFVPISVRKNYYSNPKEDAIILKKEVR